MTEEETRVQAEVNRQEQRRHRNRERTRQEVQDMKADKPPKLPHRLRDRPKCFRLSPEQEARFASPSVLTNLDQLTTDLEIPNVDFVRSLACHARGLMWSDSGIFCLCCDEFSFAKKLRESSIPTFHVVSPDECPTCLFDLLVAPPGLDEELLKEYDIASSFTDPLLQAKFKPLMLSERGVRGSEIEREFTICEVCMNHLDHNQMPPFAIAAGLYSGWLPPNLARAVAQRR